MLLHINIKAALNLWDRATQITLDRTLNCFQAERLYKSLAFVLIQPVNMYFLLSLSFIT